MRAAPPSPRQPPQQEDSGLWQQAGQCSGQMEPPFPAGPTERSWPLGVAAQPVSWRCKPFPAGSQWGPLQARRRPRPGWGLAWRDRRGLQEDLREGSASPPVSGGVVCSWLDLQSPSSTLRTVLESFLCVSWWQPPSSHLNVAGGDSPHPTPQDVSFQRSFAEPFRKPQ